MCFIPTDIRRATKSIPFYSTRPRTYSRSFRLKIVSLSLLPSLRADNDISSEKKVRRALVEAPENVATLVRVITSRLFNLVSDHTFPSAPTSYVPSFASSLINRGATERNATKEVLNCLRVLQRVLPVVFELESEPSVFEREVLWKRDVVAAEEQGGQDHCERTEQAPQFVIEDDEDENDAESATPSVAASSPQIPSKQPNTTALPSIAERLFSCLVDLLFCCGFTLPAKLQVDHYKINYVIW